MRLLLAVLLVCSPAFAQDWSSPGAFAAGHRITTIPRPDGSTFTAQVFYPARLAGDNTPVATATVPFPAVIFAHGAQTAVGRYRSTLDHLATRGFVIVAPESQPGPNPDQGVFATDLLAGMSWLGEQDAAPASFLYGVVDSAAFGLLGHGAGGGAALLAGTDPRVRTVAALAPVEASPSAVGGCGLLTVPAIIVSGDRDAIAPAMTHARPMFAALPASRQLITVHGGFHCGFLDGSSLGCDAANPDLSRADQLRESRAALTPWLLAHLGGPGAAGPVWRWIWGPEGEIAPRCTREIDPGATIAAPDHFTVDAGVPAVLSISLLNYRNPSAFAVSILADGVASDEVLTAVIEHGESRVINLVPTPDSALFPSVVRGILRARRLDDGVASTWRPIELALRCPADFNDDAFLDFFDYDDFVNCFEAGRCPPGRTADYNGDDFADFFDYDDFVRAFESGC